MNMELESTLSKCASTLDIHAFGASSPNSEPISLTAKPTGWPWVTLSIIIHLSGNGTKFILFAERLAFSGILFMRFKADRVAG